MSYERMEKRAAKLEAEVSKWLSSAEAADAAEDKLYGRDKTGEEMPDWVADKKRRAETIRAAKAALEAEAKAAAEAKVKERGRGRGETASRRPQEARVRKPLPLRRARSQSPEELHRSRKPDHEVEGQLCAGLKRSGRGRCRGTDHRGASCDAGSNDRRRLAPMTDAIETNLGRKPEQFSAKPGYCSNANIEALETRRIDSYIAPGRTKDTADGAAEVDGCASLPTPAQRPRQSRPAPQRASRPCAESRLAVTTAPTGCAAACPRPVFGQIKQARGFRHSSYGASKRCKRNGALSAPHTIC